MAKDRDAATSAARKLEKEEKKKKKRSEEDGVHKSSKDKSEKKEKKAKREALAEKALNEATAVKKTKSVPEADTAMEEDGEEEDKQPAATPSAAVARPVGALVPFANPLADEKVAKKVFKSVKKGVYASFSHSLKRLRCPTPPVLLHCTQRTCMLTTSPSCSCCEPRAETRRQRSRQGAAQICRLDLRHIFLSDRRRRARGRHQPDGRHLAHPRAVRGPRRAVRVRDEPCRAGHGGPDEAADERRHGRRGPGRAEEGRQGGRGWRGQGRVGRDVQGPRQDGPEGGAARQGLRCAGLCSTER